jgi:hypothetical protein
MPLPTITSITPSSGQPGTLLTVRGTDFVATPRVTFGTTLAAYVVFVSATELRVRVPLVGAQVQDLTVLNPDLSSVAEVFTVLAPGGWGKAGYGVSSFGASMSGSVSMASALAISTREVDVVLTGGVMDNSPFVDGDALNPSTWNVQRLDTLEYLTVIGVTQVGTNTYRLQTLLELGPASTGHLAMTASLRTAGGSLLGTPRQAAFLGLLDAAMASNTAKLATRKHAQRDYANARVTAEGSTLVVNAGGDYETVSGAELVKKLLLRRLTTKPGDFFHLPNYGLGLEEKEPLRISDIGKLKTAIEAQALEEPEVESVSAEVTMSSNGVLTCRVRARLRATGQDISVSYSPSDVVL